MLPRRWLGHPWIIGSVAAGAGLLVLVALGWVIFWLLAQFAGRDIPDLRAGLGVLIVLTLVTGAFMLNHLIIAFDKRTPEPHRAKQIEAAAGYMLVSMIAAGFTTLSYWERFHTYQGIYEAAFDDCMVTQGGWWDFYAEWVECPAEAQRIAAEWQQQQEQDKR